MPRLSLHIVLVEPEIAPNTGNAIRLCANVGAQLHLIGPMGFPLDSAKMRRAGLDYHELAIPRPHTHWQAFLETESPRVGEMWALSSKAESDFHSVDFRADPQGAEPTAGGPMGEMEESRIWLVFGPETRGLSAQHLAHFLPGHRLRLPMRPGNRSLNLSNAVAVCAYEVWRQWHFAGKAA